MSSPLANGSVRARPPECSPDGALRLPPIVKPPSRKEDPYAKSKLMTFRMSKHKQDLLTKIM